MAKWADFVITRVRFNAAETHIDEVEVGDDTGDGVGTLRREARATVIANLKDKKTYFTAPRSKSDPGKYSKGAAVGIVRVKGTEYIRTDADDIARDNLDNLPRY